MEKIILKSGEQVTFGCNNRRYSKAVYQFGYIVEYPMLNTDASCGTGAKARQKEAYIKMLEDYKNGKFRVKQGCIMAGLEFNGELLRNGRIWNKDSQGQSFDFQDCIKL